MRKKVDFDLEEFRGRQLPTQDEIMVGWKGDNEKPAVSVLCNTYNHEYYIEDAIRGFLIQKTDFPFEVIIHDDASTNDNLKKIRTYLERYPDIFRLIAQADNQYSQGKKPTILSFPYAQGDYIALCEGDDFWVSEVKLQKQYDSLEENLGADGCAHSALALSPSGELRLINSYPFINLSCKFVAKKGGGVVPTASLFLRRSVIEKFSQLFSDAPLGDYFIQVLAAENGGLKFHDEALSVYRYSSATSVSQAEKNKTGEQMREFVKRFEKTLDKLIRVLPEEYKDSVINFKASMYKEAAMRALFYGNDKALYLELLTLSRLRVVSNTHRVMLFFAKAPIFVKFLYGLRKWFLG